MATNEYDPNTGKKLKKGETVVNKATGEKVTQGTEFKSSSSSSSSSSSKSSSSSSSSTTPSLSTPINIDSNPSQTLAPGQVYTYKGVTYTQPGATTTSVAKTTSTPTVTPTTTTSTTNTNSTTTPSTVRNADGTITVTREDGYKFVYDSTGGKLLSSTLPNATPNANNLAPNLPENPSVATPATTTSISSNNLKIGLKGQPITDLQNFLISQGYSVGPTGADGIYGVNTEAAVKAYQAANNLTSDGVVGTNTAAKMNGTLPTAPATIPIDMTVPTPETPPVLPTQTSDTIQDSYMTSLNTQIANLQLQIDTQRQQQLDQIQQDKQQAQQDIADLRSQQSDMISEQGATALAAKEAKLEETQKEIARFDEAYKVKQGLTTQLQDMITQGNALILAQKATTGLTAIRNPRVNETISELSAAAAVLKIGIDAQDNNMTQVQNQLGTAVSAITSAYKDQLDYYTTLNNFYESSVTDEGNKLINLTAAEQDFMTSTINTLQDKIDTVQKNADTMQELFMDPSTATAFARAGISLTTPQSEWGTKLAKQSYSDELSEQSKEMASAGYTALIAGSAPAGAETVSITDSKGVTKTYWKKGDGTGASGGIVPTGMLQTAIDSGMSPEEAALDVASYYDSIGVPVNQTVLNTWIENARTLQKKIETPVVAPTTSKANNTAPQTVEDLGRVSAPVVKNIISPSGSPIGAIGPKQIIDVATGIGDFFKGLSQGL